MLLLQLGLGGVFWQSLEGANPLYMCNAVRIPRVTIHAAASVVHVAFAGARDESFLEYSRTVGIPTVYLYALYRLSGHLEEPFRGYCQNRLTAGLVVPRFPKP